jgi:hypothetical protein
MSQMGEKNATGLHGINMPTVAGWSNNLEAASINRLLIFYIT